MASGISHRKGRPASRRPAQELADQIEGIIHAPTDLTLLKQALTHRSYAYENGGLPHNERLEFLGDSVLGLVVTESLYADHPDVPEGQLAKQRAAVVNMRALAEAAASLELGDFLYLGRGEDTTGGRTKVSILADTTEAVIGAVYLAHGIEIARVFVHFLVDPLLHHSARLGAGLDWKTSLQELVSSKEMGAPEYRVSEAGPDHEKTFTAHVVVQDTVLGEGEGRSKKEAEQKAAALAWEALSEDAAGAESSGSA